MVRLQTSGEGSLPRYAVVATARLEQLRTDLEDGTKGIGLADLNVEEQLDQDTLARLEYRNPVHELVKKGHSEAAWVGQTAMVLPGDHVTADSGTGLVHTAPAHGPDDYQVWLEHSRSSGSDILDVVDADGLFRAEAGNELAGLSVLKEGTQRVIQHLRETGNLFHHTESVLAMQFDS